MSVVPRSIEILWMSCSHLARGLTRGKAAVSAAACIGVLCAVATAHSQREDADRPARLEVTVSSRSAPAPDASVIAVAEDHQHVVSAKTSADGRAVLLVPPGRYRISALLRGHHGQTGAVRADSGAVISLQLMVAAEDPHALTPPGFGVVSGRVLSLNGEPLAYARVTLRERYGFAGGSMTAADGTFRFTARAQLSPDHRYEGFVVDRILPPPTDVSEIVLLPDRTEIAFPVQVREKQETSGLDLRVSTTPHFRVTVTLVGELGRVPNNAAVTLFSSDRTRIPFVRSDRTATFGGVGPGPVTAYATADGSEGVRLAGIAQFEVRDRPVDDIVVQLVAGARLRGRVEFAVMFAAGSAPPQILQPMRVLSTPPGQASPGWGANEANGRVEPDGTFSLEGLIGNRCVHLVNIPAGWTLSGIVREGRHTTNYEMMFGTGEDVDNVVFELVPGEGSQRPPCGRR